MAVLSLAGCGGDPPRLDVAGKWTASVKEFGLTPLYPMQEDVAIGDVFVTMTAARGEKGGDWLLAVASDRRDLLHDALDRAYANRLAIEPEPSWEPKAEPAPDPVKGAPRTAVPNNLISPVTPARYDIYSSGAPTQATHMRRVALPGLSVARVSSAELAAGATVSGAMVRAGAGGSSSVGMEITLGGLEEVHLPLVAALDQLRTDRWPMLARQLTPGFLAALIAQTRPDLLGSFCAGDLDRVEREAHPRVLVANQVVYAHKVDYSYMDGSTLVGQLSVALANATGGVTTTLNTSTTSTDLGPPPAPGTPPSAAQSQRAASAALDATTTALQKLASSTAAPGGALQFGLSRTGNLALSESFNQPMAIGFGSAVRFGLNDLVPVYWRLYRMGDPKSPDYKSGNADAIFFHNRIHDAFEVGDSTCGPAPGLLNAIAGSSSPVIVRVPSPPSLRYRGAI
jgi:hypothetical protein